MSGEREAVRAWAVLGRIRNDEPCTLDRAVIYPLDTDQDWLEIKFPGRVLLVEIRPLPHDKEVEAVDSGESGC